MKLAFYLFLSAALHVVVLSSIYGHSNSPNVNVVQGENELLDVSFMVVEPERTRVELKPAPKIYPTKTEVSAKKASIPVARKVRAQNQTPNAPKTAIEHKAGARWIRKVDYKRNPAPKYPKFSRIRGHQGLVVLKVLVSADGKPVKVEIQSSSGYRLLDRSAEKSLKDWEFVPAKRGDQSISMEVLIPIKFELKS